jgi:XTP/dITP diphosphohydrolase
MSSTSSWEKLMTVELRILTKNEHKAREFSDLFAQTKYQIIPDATKIDEIQTEDMRALVKDKVIKAFTKIGRPIFVDHTGLYFSLLNGFPGGLTEIFWNRLRNEGIAKIVGQSSDTKVRAVTLIGYCDGKKVHIFEGEINGNVPNQPRGPEGFQWDPIFVPDGHTKTFAEMGTEKNNISMRRLAIDAFRKHLEMQ